MDNKKLVRLYFAALQRIIENSYGQELIDDRLYPAVSEYIPNLSPSDFLREYAWVVFGSGFKNSIINDRWPELTSAYMGWDPFLIAGNQHQVVEDGSKIINSTKKNGAIIKCSEIIQYSGWDKFKSSLLRSDYLDFLDNLPFIGGATKYHLAKYIGYDIAKPDRHLLFLAEEYGYECSNDGVQKCVFELAKITGERVRAIDTLLFRASELGANLTVSHLEQNDFLDTLWQRYPEVYEEYWIKNIAGSELINKVAAGYPEIFKEINKEIGHEKAVSEND
jgi:hypothetical protein